MELHHKLSGLPAVLKKEKEKQLREAAIARGEVVPDATVAPAKKKIMLADFKAQADRLYPDGIAAPGVAVPPPPPAAVAPLPPAAVAPRYPPRLWRRGAGSRPAPLTWQRRWATRIEAAQRT